MVSSSDIKYYKSANGGLGGPISGTQIISATSNNLHDTISRTESVNGDTEYKCFYIKNTHGSEKLKDVDVFLKADNPNSERSRLEWGLEYNPNDYHFGPFFEATGANFDSTADTGALDVTTFTVCAWFKCDTNSTDMYIVNKGQNSGTSEGMNYAIYIISTGEVACFFYDTGNTIRFLQTSGVYDDGIWHFVVMRYTSGDYKLYVDDMVTAKATSTVSVTPRTNAQDLVIARYSFGSSNFFTGEIDEVRVFNRAIPQSERIQLMSGSSLSNGLVFEKDFGTDNGSDAAQTIPGSSTAPTGVVWLGVTNGPVSNTPNVGTLGPGASFPVWTKRINQTNAQDAEDDYAIFQVNAKIETAGSGGSGDDDDVTAPEPDWDPFTFCIAGDWDGNSTTEDVVSAIKAVNPRIVISAGDNQYDDPPSKGFFDAIKPIDTSSIQFETAFGNHDNGESEDSTSLNQNKDHFGYSRTYNKFTIQNVLFITIDNTTETDFNEGSSQWNQIKTWLSDARKSTSKIDWIVVVAHKPMFGASSKHGYNDDDFNDEYGPLFNTYKVDLCVFGHNHNWQITKQVKYDSGSPTSPDVIDSTSPYVGGKGFLHAVSGTGGHDSGDDLYSLGSQPSYQAYQNRDYNGFLKGVLSNNNKTLTVSFVNDSGSTKYTAVINR